MSSIQLTVLIVFCLLVINLLAYLSFYLDKTAAVQGRRRISESTLLSIALLGGSLGCVLGQQKFRHKTRKQPFKAQLYFIIVLQAILLVAICFPEPRKVVFDIIKDMV